MLLKGQQHALNHAISRTGLPQARCLGAHVCGRHSPGGPSVTAWLPRQQECAQPRRWCAASSVSGGGSVQRSSSSSRPSHDEQWQRLSLLMREIEVAVADERYALAARLRDKCKVRTFAADQQDSAFLKDTSLYILDPAVMCWCPAGSGGRAQPCSPIFASPALSPAPRFAARETIRHTCNGSDTLAQTMPILLVPMSDVRLSVCLSVYERDDKFKQMPCLLNPCSAAEGKPKYPHLFSHAVELKDSIIIPDLAACLAQPEVRDGSS